MLKNRIFKSETYEIMSSINADSRTAVSKDKKDLKIDTLQHIKDVQSIMGLMSMKLIEQSISHDYTKLSNFNDFYSVWENTTDNFIDSNWYQDHVQIERHHSSAYEHDDYNLLDLIEEIIDKVCAGKGRNGEIDMKYFDFNSDLLSRAVINTIKLVDNMTKTKFERSSNI